MKIKLPLIGEIKTGKDNFEPEVELPAVISVEHDGNREKVFDVLGGILSSTKGSLSNEKSISHRILEANKEWVYRNNDVIAQEVSKMDFELYGINLRGGEIEFELIEDHPLLDLLDKFNPRTTKTDGVYMTQSHKKLTGDAFWLLDKNGQTVDNIYILPPDKIELTLGTPNDATEDLVKMYIYTDTIDGREIKEEYEPDQIIHFKKPNPKNPFRGFGAVEALADTIDSDNLTNLVQRNFFEKGAISNFVLTTDNKITQDQLKRIKAEMRAMYGGAQNAFTTMIFGNGLKPAEIGFSNKDMQFLDILEWYRDKIMVGFGNTKASIGIVDDVNRASFDGSYSGWLRSTVKPDMDSIVNTINEYLVPLFGDNLILGYKDPVPEDVTDDVLEAVQLKNGGIMTINEARERVGLDAIDGGDIFAPSGGVATPTDPNAPEEPKPAEDPAPADDEKSIRIYRRPQDKYANAPAALRHLELKSLLRARGIFFDKRINQQVKEAFKPVIRKMLDKKHKDTEPAQTIHSQFTDDQMNTYYEKQIHIVDVLQDQFHAKVLSLLDKVKEEALNNFEHEIKTTKGLKRFMSNVNKELFDEHALHVQAQIDLTPILMQEVILAGQEAYRLIGVEDTYIPFKIEASIREIVDRFATSMLSTDKDQLAKIISDGLEAGDSITEIRDSISTKFGDYTKVQAERITRTEVLRASNMAAEDAFIQSGVVEAKQWLCAPGADEVCAPYNGKISKLGADFYSPNESGFQDGNPPLHINCRCVLVPIVVGTRGFDLRRVVDDQRELILKLEAQIDKRTKGFKQLKTESAQQNADDKAYIKALEKYLGVEGED